MEQLSAEAQKQVEAIIAEAKGIPTIEIPKEEQEKYLRGYSVAALVFSFFYFRAMQDRLFMWLSIIFSVSLFPLLLVLPFPARQRAWENGNWQSFQEFKTAQQKWDRAGWYGFIVFIIISYLFLRISAGFFQSLLVQNSTSSDPTQQLKDLEQSLQNP